MANRLDVYEKQTAPLLDYYRQRGLLAPVAGEGAGGATWPPTIRQAVKRAVPA